MEFRIQDSLRFLYMGRCFCECDKSQSKITNEQLKITHVHCRWLLLKCSRICMELVHQSVKSDCAQPPPPSPGHCGAFAYLVGLGSGSLGNFKWPGDRAFAYSGATPALLTRSGFVSLLTWRSLLETHVDSRFLDRDSDSRVLIIMETWFKLRVWCYFPTRKRSLKPKLV